MTARLLQQFRATVRDIDRAASAVTGDAHLDALASLLGDTPPVPTVDGVGERQRIEGPDISFRVQFEPDNIYDLSADDGGLQTDQEIRLTTLRKNLLNAGLIDDKGNVLMGQGTRLVFIHTTRSELVWEPAEKPGLFFNGFRRRGWGISVRRPRQDLYTLIFAERDAMPRRVRT